MTEAAFWAAAERVRGDLLARYAASGVVRVELVVDFEESERRRVWPWLATTTDEERDALMNEPVLAEEANALVARHGLKPGGGVTVQSEETVARDFDGSWFNAMR